MSGMQLFLTSSGGVFWPNVGAYRKGEAEACQLEFLVWRRCNGSLGSYCFDRGSL